MASNLFGLSAASFYALGKKNNTSSVSGNYVTLDTVQTITANKIFANLNVQNILGVDIAAQGNIYLTGFIQFSDGSIQSTATPSTQSYVTLDTNQTITGIKSFSNFVYCNNSLSSNVVFAGELDVGTIKFGDGSTQTTATTNAQISTTTVQGGTYYPVLTTNGQGINNTTPYTSNLLSIDNDNTLVTVEEELVVKGIVYASSTQWDKRQMFSSFYNFYDATGGQTALNYVGRMYASPGGMVFDLSSQPSGVFTFYSNNAGVATTPLQITPTAINAVSINCSGVISGDGSGLTNLNVVSPTFNTTTATTGIGTLYPVWTLGGYGTTNVTPYTSLNISYLIDYNLLTIPNVQVYGTLEMIAASAATRSISCSYYRFYTNADGAYQGGVQQGVMYSDNTGIVFDLSDTLNKNFTFYANNGGAVATPLVITPVEIQANTHIHVPNQISIRLGAFQQTVGANSARILQQGEYTAIANNATGGTINLTTTSNSNQFATQLSVSSALIALTADNNTAPTAAPGNNTTTIATTAFVTNAVTSGGVGSKTYTIQYTTTQSITLPASCIGIAVRCVGQGGTAGYSTDGNGGNWGAGGSGGGGGTCYNLGIIPLYDGAIIQLNFSGYTEILLTSFGSASLCRANNGGNGSNGSGGNGGAAGVGGGVSNLNTTFGDWATRNGTNGISGSSNNSYQNYAQIPSSAGYPVGIPYIDSPPNFGCGQRWGYAMGVNAPQDPPYPSFPIASGVCFITYYLK